MNICTRKDDIWPVYPVFWVRVDSDIRIKLAHIIQFERCQLGLKGLHLRLKFGYVRLQSSNLGRYLLRLSG